MNCLKKLFPFALAVLIAGCSSVGSYNSDATFDKSLNSDTARKAMAYEGIARNPVIVIHGFLGAKLRNQKTGENVWGDFRFRDIFGIGREEKLRNLALPMAQGQPLRTITSDVEAVGLLEQAKVTILGISFKLDEYEGLIAALRRSGYYAEGEPLPADKHFASLFIFYYDWRRDLPENAARLQKFILEKRAYVQAQFEKNYQIKNFDVQFDIIAHSMGGLLSRYYLRYGDQDLPADGSLPKLDWRGHNYIDKLVIVGTPNAGYLDTILEMTQGLQAAPGAPVCPPAVIGTFPSYYQMMPVSGNRAVLDAAHPEGKEVDLYDPNTWIAMRWGLANPDQDDYLQMLLPNVSTPEARRAIALDHLTKCLRRAKQFTAAMRIKAVPPDDVSLFLFAGDAVPTRRTAVADRQTGELTVTATEAGDGKVLASSARYDLSCPNSYPLFPNSPIKWDGVYHLRAAHMGITNSDDFANNASYLLLFFPTKRQSALREAYRDLRQPLKL